MRNLIEGIKGKTDKIKKILPDLIEYHASDEIENICNEINEIADLLIESLTEKNTQINQENGGNDMENKKVTICLEALFNRLTGHDTEEDYVPTEYGYIQKETDEDKEWFDLKTNDGTPCMDGEICEILEETEQYILLQEIDEHIPFKLSKEEFEIAAVECQ